MQSTTETTKKIVKFSKTKAHQRYRTKAGVVVPGVTTILAIISKGDALLRWANQCGLRGEDCFKVRDQAADIGTLAHWMCECHIQGLEPDLSEFSKNDIDLATNSFIKFLEWWEANKMQPLKLVNQHGEETTNEVQLVSEQHLFGGTLDLPCLDRDGRRVLADFKTCKAIYPEQIVQVSAYDHLSIESGNPPFDRWLILRIGKEESGDFEMREIGARKIKAAWDYFESISKTYYKKKAFESV